MKLDALRTLVKEELKKTLSEEYQDKFKMVGTLISNIESRPQTPRLWRVEPTS